MSTDAQHLTRARFAEMERQLAAVTAQRDELLAALEVAHTILGVHLRRTDAADSNALDYIEAAIAKVQS